MGKANRVRYSRWDGTQVGFDLDATDIFSEITDDLLYHGDLNAALRRMMQSGFTDANGERLKGLREMLDELRRKRREALENHDLGGVYDDIARELREVIEQEREAIDELAQEARESGDARRQELTEEVAAERHAALDLLSPDLANMVRELQNYDFTSSEAREHFEELVEKLREQLMQQYVDQMSGAVENMTPEDMSRMKDMFAELNQMLEAAPAGRGARLRRLHGALRRLLPGEPAGPRRAARDHGPPHGRGPGDAQLDDPGAAGPAAGALRPAARGHGPAVAGRPAGPEPGRACSPTSTGTGATTSPARTR